MYFNTYLNYTKSIFLFICLVYGFIPFEAGSYEVSLRIHYLFLIPIMIYALYTTSFKLSKYGVLFFLFFLFISSMLFFVSYGHAIFSFFPAIIFASVVAPAIYKNNNFKKYFTQAIKILIVISVITFFIQFTTYQLTGVLLPLHELVFPFSKARTGVESQYNDLARMGGIYIEPGTYSNYLFMLIGIYTFLIKKIDYVLLTLAAISIILTFSVWGMIFASYLLIILILSKLVSVSWKIKILLITFLLVIGSFSVSSLSQNPAIDFALNKMESNKGSTEHKKDVYKKYANEFDTFFIVGQGFAPVFKQHTVSLQDSGLLLNLSIVFGIVPTIIFILIYSILLLKLTNYFILLISLPIFMSKLFYWDPAFWLFFFMIFYEYMIKYSNINLIRN